MINELKKALNDEDFLDWIDESFRLMWRTAIRNRDDIFDTVRNNLINLLTKHFSFREYDLSIEKKEELASLFLILKYKNEEIYHYKFK